MLIFAWGQVYCGSKVETIMKVRMQEGKFSRWSSQEMMVEMERKWISRTFVFTHRSQTDQTEKGKGGREGK